MEKVTYAVEYTDSRGVWKTWNSYTDRDDAFKTEDALKNGSKDSSHGETQTRVVRVVETRTVIER